MPDIKIGIGTVQFGLDYGISNASGRTPEKEVRRILALAGHEGIRVLDTAALYGQSEAVLGQTLPETHAFSIVTKTPKFDTGRGAHGEAERLEAVFRQSLQNLRQPRVYGLLIHRAADLLTNDGKQLFDKMVFLRERGFVRKIGASVYSAEEIDGLLDRYQLDLVQIPVSILDQRLIQSGHLSSLKKAGVEVHARSVFLQGLLLMQPDSLPAHFSSVSGLLRGYFETIARQGLTPLQAALGFVNSLSDIDVVICGVNNRLHLEEICRAAETRVEPDHYARFAVAEEAVINPSLWERKS
jgi:aryl-alcohol dehydrogenase-like predicted oxidoreductase